MAASATDASRVGRHRPPQPPVQGAHNKTKSAEGSSPLFPASLVTRASHLTSACPDGVYTSGASISQALELGLICLPAVLGSSLLGISQPP